MFVGFSGLLMTATGQNRYKSKVAVYVSGNLSKINKQIVSSQVIEWISRSDTYAAFERTAEFMEALDAEHDFQLSGDVSNEQIVSMGNRWGAEYVAAIRVLLTEENTHYVTGRLLDLETGEVIKSMSRTRKISTTEELISFANSIAYQLFVQNK